MVERKFETDGEHQEDDAQVRQRVDCVHIGDQVEGKKIWSDQDACGKITDDHRHLHLSEDHRGESSYRQYDGELHQEAYLDVQALTRSEEAFVRDLLYVTRPVNLVGLVAAFKIFFV